MAKHKVLQLNCAVKKRFLTDALKQLTARLRDAEINIQLTACLAIAEEIEVVDNAA